MTLNQTGNNIKNTQEITLIHTGTTLKTTQETKLKQDRKQN